jgi:hypothetical protein
MYKTAGLKNLFDAVLDAQAPDRFSQRFLETLGYKSKGDRLFIGLLKSLGFLDADGKPSQRYFDFLDRSQSKKVLAEAIEEAYSDLFAVNTQAYELNANQAKDKLRTLYAGKKTDGVITQIARTFEALCALADFSSPATKGVPVEKEDIPDTDAPNEIPNESATPSLHKPPHKAFTAALQYHINIVLPETRDQAVYDAIFKSLRDHLG